MEALGAAASVVAIIQITAQIYDLCRTYYVNVRDARRDIQRLQHEVTSLERLLTSLADLYDDSDSNTLRVFGLLNEAGGPMQQCQAQLSELVTRLDIGEKGKVKQFGLRALKWPLNSKDVDKTVAIINRHKASFTLALSADHIKLSNLTRGDIARLDVKINDLQIGQRMSTINQQRQAIDGWLAAPKPTINHKAACRKRQPNTGTWFLKCSEFSEWKITPNSFMWLHAIPGGGKTILCSTIIEDLMLYCQTEEAAVICIFYFDFNDSEKQTSEGLVRSFISQLSERSEDTPEFLTRLYSSNSNKAPEIDTLLSILLEMLKEFGQTFFVIDALDECRNREKLMNLLEEIHGWDLEKLHLLATSRKEVEITDTLDHLVTNQMSIQARIQNLDILTHVHQQLQSDSKLGKWPETILREIEETLVKGAHGMFRWVVCQLDELRKCLKLKTLQATLRSLPRTLDETYTRILSRIDEQYKHDAFEILLWLAYSSRPLLIQEVAEVVAFDFEGDIQFDKENRLRDPNDTLVICSSLVSKTVTIVIEEGHKRKLEHLGLAHFSVKEYLISDRAQFGLDLGYRIESMAHEHIAKACLVYLLQPFKPEEAANHEEYPLALYAAAHWIHHARLAFKDGPAPSLLQLLLDFFLRPEGFFRQSLSLYHPESDWISVQTSGLDYEIPPLYFCCLAGLLAPAESLLDMGADIEQKAGCFGSALQAASAEGNESIVQLLVERGANINAQGGCFGTALIAASRRGRESMIRYLVEHGADLMIENSYYGNALTASARDGHTAAVQFLLENGMDVNLQSGYYGNALQAASGEGREPAVRLLLDKGAAVNTRGGYYPSALYTACAEGRVSTAKLLLERGADPNMQGGQYGSALQAAITQGLNTIVRLLIDFGADVNLEGGQYGSAMHAAVANRLDSSVGLLLQSGANPNSESARFGIILRVASAMGDETIVGLLLEYGAEVNASDRWGTALEAAQRYGHINIVRLLRDAGAQTLLPQEEELTSDESLNSPFIMICE
ncbi:hypothetical protein MMC18_008164 [Xylographa bjoerkii]|nr:hypothetical protein [Xylographa bjoerkii]